MHLPSAFVKFFTVSADLLVDAADFDVDLALVVQSLEMLLKKSPGDFRVVICTERPEEDQLINPVEELDTELVFLEQFS